MFIGREGELKFLNDSYEKPGFCFVPIYGRRRVGKTELIREFTKDKENIIYSAMEQSAALSISQFSRIVLDHFNMSYLPDFTEWDQLFSFIGNQEIKERIIIAIDEYPYLAKRSPELSSVLQKHMDITFKDKDIMVILCGSSMTFMEEQVLGYQSPLYGRRTGQIKLKPLSYREAGMFIPDRSKEEKFMLYSVADGIPQYLEILSSYDDLEHGIVENMFKTTGHLYEETSNLLKQELRDPANYSSIITAVAAGKSRLNEIATTAGLDATSISKYLKSLINLGIIEKILPAGKKEAKRGIYRVADNYFAFWFRLVAPKKTGIEYGRGDSIAEDIVRENLPTFQGCIFEKVAADYLMRNEIFKDVIPMDVGAWWGSNKHLKRNEEIDLVCSCSDDSYIIGECKWRNEKIDIQIYEDLRRKSELLGFAERKRYCLFAKKGFSERLKEIQKYDDNLALISLDDMY